jgi:hypothetical protein
MNQSELDVPVVLIIFNRPELTQQVLTAIANVQPKQLFVIADGPRPTQSGDLETCAATRKLIGQINWDCQVQTNFSDINLGCKQRVSTGLNWVFEQTESAIILEDDCVPDASFFEFCAQLLQKYQDDQRIMAISGNNFQFGRKRTDYSYYFSRYPHCWGWATWKRAWQHYDMEMKLWSEINQQDWLNDPFTTNYWQKKFQSTYDGEIDSWAFRWTFACWIQSGLTILPNVNLVSNIGFTSGSTHNHYSKNPYANMPVEAMQFPLQHPPFMIRDQQADAFTQVNKFGLSGRIRRKIRQALGI